MKLYIKKNAGNKKSLGHHRISIILNYCFVCMFLTSTVWKLMCFYSIGAGRESSEQANNLGNHSERGLPDGSEPDWERQWFREIQADLCQVRTLPYNIIIFIIMFDLKLQLFLLLFSFRMDGIQKNVAETKDYEHRLRSLENDVNTKFFFSCFHPSENKFSLYLVIKFE